MILNRESESESVSVRERNRVREGERGSTKERMILKREREKTPNLRFPFIFISFLKPFNGRSFDSH